jgi:hypothetical protein
VRRWNDLDRVLAGRKRPVVVEVLLDLADDRPFEAKMDVSDRCFRPQLKQVLGANV